MAVSFGLASAPVMFWIVPPLPSLATEPAAPVTVKPPDAPVLFRKMPFEPPFEEMLRNVRPLAPMVVLATLSAVPVVVVSVFTIEVLFCVALTVPPPVALKAVLTQC